MGERADDGLRDLEFAESIATYVIPVLENRRFFELLDDLYSPIDPASTPRKCDHSFAGATEVLKNLGMDPEETADILAVMKARGGCCDCEILYNVAEESRLKAEYWQTKHRELS